MWDYKVIAGKYSLDGADVVVENPLGKGTLQRILDHYGNEGFELSTSHYDNLNREVVILLKRPKGGAEAVAAAPAAMGAGAAAAPARARRPLPDDEDDVPRRGGGADKGGGRRRSKADLDRLYRET